jgi:polyglycine hydrolase-like protein
MTRTHVFKATLLAVTAAAASLAVTAGAHAAVGPADDRLRSTPTGWWCYPSLTPDEVENLFQANNARITDLRIAGVSPLRFSVTMVRNTGAYAVANWGWFYAKSFDQVGDILRDHGSRPISLHGYVDGDGRVRYAGAMVPNTGANYRNWKVVSGSKAVVLDERPAGWRPMTLATYLAPDDTRKYVSIMVDNVENYEWSWHFRVTAWELEDLQQPYNSLVDLSALRNEEMHLAVVLYHNLPTDHGVIQGTTYYDTDWHDIISAAIPWHRPLLMTFWTLHGSGTADGETQFVSVFRDNY